MFQNFQAPLFVDSARTEGDNKFWSVLGTLLLVVGAFLVGQIPLAIIVFVLLTVKGLAHPENLELAIKNPQQFGIDSRWVLVGIVFSFAIATGALAFGIRWFHKRRLREFWAGSGPGLPRLLKDGLILLLLMAASDLIAWLTGIIPYNFNSNFKDTLITLLIACLFIPIQACTEELVFRGYLLQQLYLLFRNPWMPAVLSSVLFALLHGANPEVQAYGFWPSMAMYFIMGIFFCLMVYLDGNLRLAMLAHTVNNIYGLAIVSYPNAVMEMPAFFMMEELNVTWALALLPVFMTVYLWIVRRWRFRYQVSPSS
ncbi:MAG: CPBP family intramembrane metalloprotease [Flavobacteriales bacterium]|nr:CPBP family intramembrane metalloprotease [Flavobacteriales bacterium]